MATINGSRRHDTLSGTVGDDTIFGFDGHDAILGRAGDDWLDGGAGDDLLFGAEGHDILLGGENNDLLRGGSGDDVIDGGDGYDRVSFALGGSDTRDLPQTGVTVSLLLQGAPQDTGHGWDTLIGIEYFSGTAFDDTLIGDDGANWIYTSHDGGRTGNDTVLGHGGNDLISVEIGDHLLDGGDGVDTFQLFDNFFLWGRGGVVSLLLQGTAQDTGVGRMTLADFENLGGSYHDDHLSGDGGGNVIAGDDGSDTLVGGEGNDSLLGDGRIEAERTTGLSYGPIRTVLDASETPDVFRSTILGGSDHLSGDAGDDLLAGGAADDILDGGGDRDELYGGRGRDLLSGGDGDDSLSGGANRDSFVMGPGSGHDVIVDFEQDELIVFRGIQEVDDFSDLTITRVGRNALISWDGASASVLLQGVEVGQLDASNFLFEPTMAVNAEMAGDGIRPPSDDLSMVHFA